MLCIGNRLISRAISGNSKGSSRTATLLSLSPTSVFVMTSRKRPASSINTSCNNSMTNQNNAGEEKEQQQYRPLVIVLAGPTAVGKSDVAAELCSPTIAADISQGHYSSFPSINNLSDNEDAAVKQIASRGHVVSADSVQAYRGVDIGANKPTLEEMECTPHHLVNVVDPPTDPAKAASYNAADWMRDASYVIQSLTPFEGVRGDDESDDGDSMDEDSLLRRDSIDKALSQSLGISNNNEIMQSESKPTILPVVVGGTMMYLQWLVHGRPDAIRPTDEAVKRATDAIDKFQRDAEDILSNDDNAVKESDSLSAKSTQEDDTITTEEDAVDIAAWASASSHVSSLGPVFKQRVDKLEGRDWYRLRRLLEVAYTIASKKKNATKDDEAANNKSEEEILNSLTEKEVYTGIRSGSLPDLGYDVRCFFLCPDDRMTHFHTVDERCEQMLLRGLLGETANLYVNGGLPEGSQVTRAIGYRQTLNYLKRKDAKRNDHQALMAYIDDFATATRQYGKKQMQWFRRDETFAFVPVQMECGKTERVGDAAKIIADMCKLHPADFATKLSSEAKHVDGSDETSEKLHLSAQTKLDNELQGKKMKFFISKRTSLMEGSDYFLKVMAEADECTQKVAKVSNAYAGMEKKC